MSSGAGGEWVGLALLRGVRGLRGEFLAESLGSSPDRFTEGLPVRLDHGPQSRDAEVERSWVHNGRLVLKFKGINSRTDAEPLVGAQVQIPIEERPPAPPGEHYLSDLIGCRMETPEGRHLGVVSACYDLGPQAVLELEDGMMVPLVPEICVNVDTANQRIVARLPEGLEELYRE